MHARHRVHAYARLLHPTEPVPTPLRRFAKRKKPALTVPSGGIAARTVCAGCTSSLQTGRLSLGGMGGYGRCQCLPRAPFPLPYRAARPFEPPRRSRGLFFFFLSRRAFRLQVLARSRDAERAIKKRKIDISFSRKDPRDVRPGEVPRLRCSLAPTQKLTFGDSLGLAGSTRGEGNAPHRLGG